MKYLTSRNKIFDLGILFVVYLVGIALSIYLNFGLLSGAIYFYLLPAIYLFYKERKQFNKIFSISVISGGPLSILICFLFEVNNVWNYGNYINLYLPFIYKNYVPLDVVFWGIFFMFYVFTFYEHFLDSYKSSKVNFYKIAKMGLFLLALSLIVVSLYIYDSRLLILGSYAYLKLSILLGIIIVPFIYMKYKIFIKTLWMVPIFSVVHLTQEILALYNGHWRFPGHYLYELQIFGFMIPLEELLFWIIISSVFFAFMYEYIWDNKKN